MTSVARSSVASILDLPMSRHVDGDFFAIDSSSEGSSEEFAFDAHEPSDLPSAGPTAATSSGSANVHTHRPQGSNGTGRVAIQEPQESQLEALDY